MRHFDIKTGTSFDLFVIFWSHSTVSNVSLGCQIMRWSELRTAHVHFDLYVECGRNKRNNLITDFQKSNTDYSAWMFVYFGLIRRFLIKTVVDDYYWMHNMTTEEGVERETKTMFFMRLKYWFSCLIYRNLINEYWFRFLSFDSKSAVCLLMYT